MDVVQKVEVEAVLVPDRLEELRYEVDVFLGRPDLVLRLALGSRLVEELAFGDAIGGDEAGNAGLGSHCPVAELEIAADRVDCLGEIISVGMAVDHVTAERLLPPSSW